MGFLDFGNPENLLKPTPKQLFSGFLDFRDFGEALGTARRRHEPSRNARCCLLSGRAFQLLRDFSAFECVV